MRIKIGAKKGFHITLSETLFIIAYGFFIVLRYCYFSTIADIMPSQFYLVATIIIISFALFSILVKKVNLKFLMVTVLGVSTSILVYYVIQEINFIFIILLIFAAYNISFKKIAVCSILANSIMIIYTIIGGVTGKFRDYTYSHQTLDGKTVIAHSYGFLYYSTVSFMILYLSIMFIYIINEKYRFKSILVLTVLNFIVYRIFTARMPFIVYLIVVGFYFAINKIRIFNLKGWGWKVITNILPTLLTIVSILPCYIYNASSSLIVAINLIFNSRASQGYQALNKYGINLFGHQIEMYGTYSLKYGNANKMIGLSYLYIDNGYLYSLLAYGIVFTVFLLIVYTGLFNFSRTRNKILYIWIFAVLIFDLVNNSFLAIEYNPIILAGISAIASNRRKTLKELQVYGI